MSNVKNGGKPLRDKAVLEAVLEGVTGEGWL